MFVYRVVWQYRGFLPWLLSQVVHPVCNMYPSDGTPLIYEAAEGDLEAMRLILDHGLDPNPQNEKHELPLGSACSSEHWEAAELLVQRGAGLNGIAVEGKTHLYLLTLGKTEPSIPMLRALGGLLYDEHGRNNDQCTRNLPPQMQKSTLIKTKLGNVIRSITKH